MLHPYEVIKIKTKNLIKELKNYTVEQFCQTVFEVSEDYQKKYINRDDVQHVSGVIGEAIRLRDGNNDLRMGQLDCRFAISDVNWIINFMLTPRRVENPSEDVTYTTPEKFMDRIKKK